MAIALRGTPTAVATAVNVTATVSLALPAGIKGGDCILFMVGWNNGGTAVICSTPTGFTLLESPIVSSASAALFYKVAAGTFGAASSDAGATVTANLTLSGSPNAKSWVALADVYSGTDITNPIHDSNSGGPGGASTTHTAPTVTVTVPNCWIVEFDLERSTSTSITKPSGLTLRAAAGPPTGSSPVLASSADSNAVVSVGTRGGDAWTGTLGNSQVALMTVALLPSVGASTYNITVAAETCTSTDLTDTYHIDRTARMDADLSTSVDSAAASISSASQTITVDAETGTSTDSVSILFGGIVPPADPGSPFQQALRSAHSIYSTATLVNSFTGQHLDLPVETGSTITVDVTAACRRVLNLVCPPLQSIYDAASVPGCEIVITQTLKASALQVTVPLGVFCVDQEGMGYRPDGQLQITAPDRWVQVQRNRFGLKRSSVSSNTASAEIVRLVEAAWPNAAFPFPGWAAGSPYMGATTKVGAMVWDDGQRDSAITALTEANSLDLFFDVNGLAVLKPLPVLTDSSPSVWTIDSSASGVMLDGTRQTDFSQTRNAVVVSSTATDLTLTPVEVKNTHDPSDDELSTLGPLGYRPAYYSSPLLRTSAQMLAAGKTLLQRLLSVATQVSLTAVSNPTLDGWDVIDVSFPPGDFGTDRPVERHMLESTQIPLTADGTQTVTLRSTRPTSDDTT